MLDFTRPRDDPLVMPMGGIAPVSGRPVWHTSLRPPASTAQPAARSSRRRPGYAAYWHTESELAPAPEIKHQGFQKPRQAPRTPRLSPGVPRDDAAYTTR